MTKKTKLKKFQVGFVVTTWMERDVLANTMESALEFAKAVKHDDLVATTLSDDTVNDSLVQVSGVSSPETFERGLYS